MKNIPDTVKNDKEWLDTQQENDLAKKSNVDFSKSQEEKLTLKEAKRRYKESLKK